MPKAEKMFRDMLNWRRDFQVEKKVAEWRAELAQQRTQRAMIIKQYETDANICSDKFGIPVRLLRLSVTDAAGASREFGREAVLVASLSKLEETHEEIRKAMFRHGKLFRGQVQIIDVGDYGPHGVPNYGSRMMASATAGPDLYKVFDLNYPETVRKVFFIRVPSLAHLLWHGISKLVPERTQKKLRFFSHNAQDWRAELLEELPPGCEKDESRVPAFLLSDSESAFASAWPKGGIIPEGTCGLNHGVWEPAPAGSAGHKSTAQLLAEVQASKSFSKLQSEGPLQKGLRIVKASLLGPQLLLLAAVLLTIAATLGGALPVASPFAFISGDSDRAH